MSNMLPPTDTSHASNFTPNTEPRSSRPSKHQRILACTSCQQRKVKCDRKLPCAVCIKSRVQCVPATLLPRQRKRRFSERALLDRLHKYEELLRQNNIRFEPLHTAREEDSPNADASDDSHDEHVENVAPQVSTPLSSEKTESVHEARYIHTVYGQSETSLICSRNHFHAMSQAVRSHSIQRENFTDQNRSFEILTTIAILHTMICGKRRSKEPGINKSKTISIFCSAPSQEQSTSSLSTPIQYRSSDSGKCI